MKIRVFYILLLILNFLQSFSQTYYIRAGKVFDGNQILNDRVIAITLVSDQGLVLAQMKIQFWVWTLDYQMRV
jgi:hypothetical protein